MNEMHQSKKSVSQSGVHEHPLPPVELLDTESSPEDVEGANSERMNIIVSEFGREGIDVIPTEILEATTITTFLFGLKGENLHQAKKIDESMRCVLEMALETSGISFQVPLPDSSLFAVHVPRKGRKNYPRLVSFVKIARAGGLKLPCPLGEDFRGVSRLIDLSVDCHQLVGGQTGERQKHVP